MRDELRPLSFGEVLDRTITLYRSRFLAFLGISAVPTVALIAVVVVIGLPGGITRVFTPGPAQPQAIAGFMVIAAVAFLLALPLVIGTTSLAYAALCHAAGLAYFGNPITIRGSYKSVWKRGWHYVWLYILIALIAGGVPFAAFMLMEVVTVALAFLAKDTAGAVLGGVILFLLFAAIVVYVILALLRMSLAYPICVTERVSAWAAVKRSNALTQGSRGRIFLMFLLVLVISWGVSTIISLMAMICIFLIPGANKPGHLPILIASAYFVSYAAQFIVQALIQPLLGISLTLFYYDQRVRLEGFDIEWMMQAAGLTVPAPPQPLPDPMPWMAADGRFAAVQAEMAAVAQQPTADRAPPAPVESHSDPEAMHAPLAADSASPSVDPPQPAVEGAL